MAIKRLDLPDGQWADLLVKPHHGEYVEISRAAEAAEDGSGSWTDWALEVGRQFTKRWHVVDEEGQDLDIADWSKADPDITDAICTEAQNRWGEWAAARVPLVKARRAARSSTTPDEPSTDTPTEAPSS